MTVLFISRHPGAHAWARNQGLNARVVTHLDLSDVSAGDVVVGTLPVHLAGAVCARGARYVHLSMSVPEHLRGKELSAEDMEALAPRLQIFEVAAGGLWNPAVEGL